MTFDEYNAARKKLDAPHHLALADPTESNISDLILAASLSGLVIMPFDHLPPGHIPTPICGVISMPTGEMTKSGPATAMHYIFPADQHIP